MIILITGNQLTGKLNDLRFYDECLSPKQVREVYKTLVCHYKLNGEIGYDENIEYDCSGYGNDSNIIKSPLFIPDSPRYNSAIDFNQSGYIENNSFELYSDEFTISFWIKLTKDPSSQHFILGTFRNGNWPVVGVGLWIDPPNHSYLFNMSTLNNASYIQFRTSSFEFNKWYHLSIVYNGTDIKYYENGVLKVTKVYGDNDKVYNPILQLGYGSYKLQNSQIDESQMSDFRMYATALSAEDVKELYNTSLIVDNEGTVSAYEIIEDEDISIDERGILKNQNIYETEAMNCAYTNYPGDYDLSWDSNFYTPSNISNATGCYKKIHFPEKPTIGQQIRIELDVEWSGGFDNSNTDGTFSIIWQGAEQINNSTNWNKMNPLASLLNSIKSLTNLVLSKESGTYHYDAIYTVTREWIVDVYNIGFRSDYSNGKGKIGFKNLKVTPIKYDCRDNDKFKIYSDSIVSQNISEI